MHIPPFRFFDRLKTKTLIKGIRYFSLIGLNMIFKNSSTKKQEPNNISDKFVLMYEQNEKQTFENTYWLGHKALKIPLDLWIYQEIIFETKPDFIIETGTNEGGSTLFLASICDLLNKGEIISIDIASSKNLPKHPRIKYLQGDATSNKIISEIQNIVSNKKTMIILDDDHSKKHVLNELYEYSKIVSKNCYLIVEDTCMSGHPTVPELNEGPMEAVHEFLENDDSLIIDKSREKFFATFNPNGFLFKIK